MKEIKGKVQMLIVGFALGLGVAAFYLAATGTMPFISAAGVGTGAPDVNAKYHDGYATSLTATSGAIYVSDANGDIPFPSGMINMFNTACPTGWTRVTALDGKFLVGGVL